ncbi:hypothetical protein ERJ75_000853600 [Trypanosoma vivax]|nr:hypothetical protein TRVL_09968 [Trypanosoma vivax]KAH8612758.1 hypothetical protein ERJ75_000853600 [Trypanosoma vivax]
MVWIGERRHPLNHFEGPFRSTLLGAILGVCVAFFAVNIATCAGTDKRQAQCSWQRNVVGEAPHGNVSGENCVSTYLYGAPGSLQRLTASSAPVLKNTAVLSPIGHILLPLRDMNSCTKLLSSARKALELYKRRILKVISYVWNGTCAVKANVERDYLKLNELKKHLYQLKEEINVLRSGASTQKVVEGKGTTSEI